MPSVRAVEFSAAESVMGVPYAVNTPRRRPRPPLFLAAAAAERRCAGAPSGREGVAPRDPAARHHGHVIGEPVEARGAIPEGMGLVEIDPADPPAGEDVIEVHAHAHEARRGPAGQLLDAEAVALREGV